MKRVIITKTYDFPDEMPDEYCYEAATELASQNRDLDDDEIQLVTVPTTPQ